jgi:hypothetical protein
MQQQSQLQRSGGGGNGEIILSIDHVKQLSLAFFFSVFTFPESDKSRSWDILTGISIIESVWDFPRFKAEKKGKIIKD